MPSRPVLPSVEDTYLCRQPSTRDHQLEFEAALCKRPLLADFCLSRLTEIDPQATDLTWLMGELTLLFEQLGMHCQDR